MAYLNFQEAQVTGSFINALFAIALFALTFRRLRGPSKVSAQLMGLGYLLAAMQFAMQRLFSFNDHDLALGISINLLTFMLVTFFIYFGLFYLQRQGNVRRNLCLTPPALWFVALMLIVVSRIVYGDKADQDAQPLMWANYIAAGLYAVEVVFLYNLVLKSYRELRNALSDYYDRSASEFIGWIYGSVQIISLLTFCLPMLMFFRTPLLVLFGYLSLAALSYLFVTFVSFVVSNNAVIASQAEAAAVLPSAAANEPGADGAEGIPLEVVESRLGSWLTDKGYLRHDLSIKDVASSLELSVTDIRRWLVATEKGMFSQWLSRLRVNYSKQLLVDQPNWSVDAIADACGFTNRQSYARAFKKETDCSPSEWASRKGTKEQKP